VAEVRHPVEQIIRAVEGSGGIRATIARKLSVHRHTVDNYLSRFPTVREAYDQEVAAVGDDAESVIIDAIRIEKDIDTAKWYARMKLRDRGYVERNEVTGKDGADIVIREVVVHEPGTSTT
jgi:hypothetical protein